MALDGKAKAKIRARKTGVQGIELVTQSRQGATPVWGRLGGQGHAHLVGFDVKTTTRLKGCLQEGSTFVLRPRKAVKAVLLVASFPAALGSNRVTKGACQVGLSGQLALAEHDTDKAKMCRVIQGDAVDGLMAAEDDTVASGIDKPQAWADKGAVVV